MRIAMLLPVADRPAVRAYGLWTRGVHELSEMLLQRGVEVTAVPIDDAGPSMPTYQKGVVGADAILRLSQLFQRASDFELIHDMIGFGALPHASFIATPIMSTVWFDMWKEAPQVYQEMNQRVYYHAPSEYDRKSSLLYTETLPWGVPLKQSPLHERPEDHLVFLGPLRPEEGVEEAIEVVCRADRLLVLFGAIQDEAFFQKEIAPHVQKGRVRYHEDPMDSEADRLIGQACGVIHVGTGAGMLKLALLDALSRGTPILALDKGFIPDFVKEGETGHRFNCMDSSVEAVAALEAIDRKSCREKVLANRSLEDLGDALVGLYERIIEQARREDHRPWGYYQVLADEPDHKVKRLVVYPEKRLSLQRHRRRSEHWFLLSGEAMVVQDDEEVRMLPGQSIEIPTGCWHRVRNPGSENLTIIEIQTGDYFGEDDIERKEDDYGRVPETRE